MFLPMIDTLVASIDIVNYDDVADKLLEELEKKKTQAKNALSDNSSKMTTIKIGDMTFEVMPNGKKGYAYLLHNGLYEVDLAQYRSRSTEFLPVYVKIKSYASGPSDLSGPGII